MFEGSFLYVAAKNEIKVGQKRLLENAASALFPVCVTCLAKMVADIFVSLYKMAKTNTNIWLRL